MSVKPHLTSGESVCPENTVMYSAGNGGLNFCKVFSKTAPLQRSSTAPLKAIRMVSCVKRMSIIVNMVELPLAMPPGKVCGMISWAPRVLHFSAFICNMILLCV